MVPLLFILFEMNSPVVLFFALTLDCANSLVALLSFAVLPLGLEVDWRFQLKHALLYLAIALPGLVGGAMLSPFVQEHISHTQLAHRGFGFIDYAIAVIFAVRAYFAWRQSRQHHQVPNGLEINVEEQVVREGIHHDQADQNQSFLSEPYRNSTFRSQRSSIDSESSSVDSQASSFFESQSFQSESELDEQIVRFRVVPLWTGERTTWRRFWVCVVATFFFGVICAILGIGGGLLYALVFMLAEGLPPFPATVGGNLMMCSSACILAMLDLAYMESFALFGYGDYWVRLLITMGSGAVGSLIGTLLTKKLNQQTPFLINLLLTVLLLIIGTLSFVIPTL